MGCAMILGLGSSDTRAADSTGLGTISVQAPMDGVLATVDGKPVSSNDVVRQYPDLFADQVSTYELKSLQLELARQRAKYDLLHDQLDALLDARALDLEAAHLGVTPAALLAKVQPIPVTDDEARAFYAQQQDRLDGGTFEQWRDRIDTYLAKQHQKSSVRDFYDGLRAKYHIVNQLQPLRYTVPARGPARGNPGAPVTIIEFGDFQCPYCREAEKTLQAVLAEYPQDVRLVFRNHPLTELHPDAFDAATAAICADRQGMFWPMHDAMYQDQTQLGGSGLLATANRLGLNLNRFSSCLTDPSVKQLITSDAQTADLLNAAGTPFFLINGRPLNGSQPLARFEAIINDELHRHAG
jgi:protein-disulfide isomerase